MKLAKFLPVILALFLCVGSVGCDDKEEAPKGKYFDCENNRPVLETLENEPVTIKYSEIYEVFVIMFNDPKQTVPVPFVPCGDSLPKEYQIEGLKVKVSGVCRDCSFSAPNIKTAPLYKVNISSIKKY